MSALAAILLLAIGVGIGLLVGRATATSRPSEDNIPEEAEARTQPAAPAATVASTGSGHVVRRQAGATGLDPDTLDAPDFMGALGDAAASDRLDAPDLLDAPDFLDAAEAGEGLVGDLDAPDFLDAHGAAPHGGECPPGDLVSPDFVSGLAADERRDLAP